MCKIYTLPLGAYQTNCYIIANAPKCVIIDPGYEPKQILHFLDAHQLNVEAILLTHGHFDHVGAVEQIVEQTGCALWMSEKDWALPMDPVHLHFYPLANCDFTDVKFCKDGTFIAVAGLSFTVLETPGHTPGSVCYQCENALFTGDTLFAGSCGRTDLPGGDPSQLSASLARLKAISMNVWVYPGHGHASTLSAEQRSNPYLQ